MKFVKRFVLMWLASTGVVSFVDRPSRKGTPSFREFEKRVWRAETVSVAKYFAALYGSYELLERLQELLRLSRGRTASAIVVTSVTVGTVVSVRVCPDCDGSEVCRHRDGKFDWEWAVFMSLLSLVVLVPYAVVRRLSR